MSILLLFMGMLVMVLPMLLVMVVFQIEREVADHVTSKTWGVRHTYSRKWDGEEGGDSNYFNAHDNNRPPDVC